MALFIVKEKIDNISLSCDSKKLDKIFQSLNKVKVIFLEII